MNVNTYKQDEEKTKFSWQNFTRMLMYFKNYKKELVISFILSVISGTLLLFIPKIFSYAIDYSFVNQNFRQIVILTIIIFVIVLLSIILSRIRRDIVNVVLNKVSYNLKLELFQKIQYLPNSFFDTRSHGKIYTRVTTYPYEASAIMCYVLLEIILDIINIIFVLIFMLSLNVKLSLISIILSILLIGVFIFLSPIIRRLKHTLNDKSSNVNAYLSESINGVRITQSFNREEKNLSIFKKLETERINAFKKNLFLANTSWSLAYALSSISMILIYYFGLRYFYPEVTVGIILAIVSYSSNFWDPISYLTSSYEELMTASVYLERIFELLDEPLVIENNKNSKIIEIKGNVEFKDVTFSYDGEKTVLNHLNLNINAGEKVGLVGETGCGKSTILNLISRFYDINDGKILIDGVDIRDINLLSLRGQISIMLQDNFLFARSVYDNLVLDKKINKKQVIKICKMLDIHDLIMSLEKGYDTILLNNGSNLSNGERQLLCIARIMIQNPRILILDEATSNIDLKTEKRIEKALEIVTKGRTTILVAHRISTIKNCDKIILVKDHKNYEEGTHKELMKKRKEYYKLYTRQSLD